MYVKCIKILKKKSVLKERMYVENINYCNTYYEKEKQKKEMFVCVRLCIPHSVVTAVTVKQTLK